MLCPNVKMRVKRPPREIAFEPPPDKIESVRFAAVTLVRHTAQRTLYPRSCNPGVNTPFAFRETISGRETDPPSHSHFYPLHRRCTARHHGLVGIIGILGTTRFERIPLRLGHDTGGLKKGKCPRRGVSGQSSSSSGRGFRSWGASPITAPMGMRMKDIREWDVP